MTRIDWTKPLETDEPTPLVVTRDDRAPGNFCTIWPASPSAPSPRRWPYDENGKPIGWGCESLPSIRNVRPVVTSDEALQRMEAFVRKLTTARGTQSHVADEARKIVALLSESSDLVEARRIADALPDRGPYASWLFADACHDDHPLVQCALAALRRGRELAGGESA